MFCLPRLSLAIVAAFAAIASVQVGVASGACQAGTANGPVDCLSKSQVPSGFHFLYSTGDPCFSYLGATFCATAFVSNTLHLNGCSCGNSECGCDSSPPATTTTQAPPPPTTTTVSSSSGSGSGSGSGGSGQFCDFAFDRNPDCSATKAKYCTPTYQRTIQNVLTDNTLCDYCGINSGNCYEVCDRELTQADKDAIVARHNELRSRVANGDERLGDPGPQPKATDMYELTWDDGLAQTAQAWADQCVMGHDKNRIQDGYLNFPYVGQNIAYSWSSVRSANKALTNKIQGWYDEVKDWPNTNIAAFSKETPNKVPNGVQVGHYTQLAWGNTKKIGCGYVANYDTDPNFASVPYRQVLVCNYGPGGNVLSRSVYTAGSTTGSACANKLPNGLCRA